MEFGIQIGKIGAEKYIENCKIKATQIPKYKPPYKLPYPQVPFFELAPRKHG
jgi:hypothetical protein